MKYFASDEMRCQLLSLYVIKCAVFLKNKWYAREKEEVQNEKHSRKEKTAMNGINDAAHTCVHTAYIVEFTKTLSFSLYLHSITNEFFC